MALPKENRLKKERDFDRIFKKGRALRGRFLLVKYENAVKPTKTAIIIPVKISKSAVRRNRIKRLLGEVLKKHLNNSLENIIILALNSAKDREEGELKDDLEQLLSRLSKK